MKNNKYYLIFNATFKSEHSHENISEITYKDLIFKKNRIVNEFFFWY